MAEYLWDVVQNPPSRSMTNTPISSARPPPRPAIQSIKSERTLPPVVIKSPPTSSSESEATTPSQRGSTVVSAAKAEVEAAEEPKEDDREGFGNDIQYLLTIIGYAVGLGNIWRFPALAYENGGGAFLVPYIICATTFGLPVIYMELAIGQYTRKGPSVAFRDYVPILQGLGWVMGIVSFSFTLFYNVIIGWAGLYLLTIITGGSAAISTCDNDWNNQTLCSPNSSSSAAEEFYNFHILRRTDSFDDWGTLNWRSLASNTVFWIFAILGLIKGVKMLGRLSLVTSTMPYIIVAILFFRGITLDGARVGIDYYLLKPTWDKMFQLETWRQALSQCCFSLAVGIGGLLAMSSYNKRNHNFLRDAIVIVVADSFMSIIGGVAVFSTLGFLAKQKGVQIDEVVQSSLALAFIVYPEAVNQMPLPYIWGFLFFIMLVLLGTSTMFGLLMGMITCLCDQFECCKRHQALVTVALGLFGVACGVLFCMGSGIYWFTVFNDFIGSLAVTITVISELIVINFIYGPFNFFDDVEEMRGKPRTMFHRIFGSSGYVIRFLVSITAPLLAVVVIIANCFHDRIVFAKTYRFPLWTEYFGWSLGLLPTVMLPALAIVNCVQFKRKGKPCSELFHVQPSHPAYKRLQRTWQDPDEASYRSTASKRKRTVV